MWTCLHPARHGSENDWCFDFHCHSWCLWFSLSIFFVRRQPFSDEAARMTPACLSTWTLTSNLNTDLTSNTQRPDIAGFTEINRRWKNFDYGNCEGLNSGVGGTKKTENSEVFAILPEFRRKKNVFCVKKEVTVATRKMVEKLRILRKNILKV